MTSLKLTLWFGLVAAYGGTAQEKSRRSNRPARPAGSLSGNPLPHGPRIRPVIGP
jgi:hypothetical protein